MNQNTYDAQNEKFLDYCDKWDKALASGIFDDAPKLPEPNQPSSRSSYFGMQDVTPNEIISESDAKYWNNLYRVSTHQGLAPDPLECIEEEDKKKIGDKAKVMAATSHPIKPSTVGVDQALEPDSLGATYTDEDLKKIEDLKLQIHDLEDKLNKHEGLGKSGKKFDAQIASLKKKVSELSDDLSHSSDKD